MMRKQGKKYMEIVKEMERYTGRRWFLSFVHKIVQREKFSNYKTVKNYI
jgi:hypothetical protein